MSVRVLCTAQPTLHGPQLRIDIISWSCVHKSIINSHSSCIQIYDSLSIRSFDLVLSVPSGYTQLLNFTIFWRYFIHRNCFFFLSIRERNVLQFWWTLTHEDWWSITRLSFLVPRYDDRPIPMVFNFFRASPSLEVPPPAQSPVVFERQIQLLKHF